MGFGPLRSGNSSPVSNIQLVLCRIGLWLCPKYILTSRLRLDGAVSPNGGEGIKGIGMSGLTRYAMQYSRARGRTSRRSVIARYLT